MLKEWLVNLWKLQLGREWPQREIECLGGMRLQSFLTLFTCATPGTPARGGGDREVDNRDWVTGRGQQGGGDGKGGNGEGETGRGRRGGGP